MIQEYQLRVLPETAANEQRLKEYLSKEKGIGLHEMTAVRILKRSIDARQRTVAFYAPSKTFNLAGLLGSYHIIYNPFLRDRVTKVSSLTHYNSSSIFAEVALLAAYTD